MSTPGAGDEDEYSLDGLAAGEYEPPSQESPEDAAKRRAADVRIAEKMRDIDYDPDHPVGRVYVKTLKQVGAGTLIVLDRDNELHGRARRLQVMLPSPPSSWPEEAYTLINEAATAAAPRFLRTGLRRWSPEGAASINTYFVNSLIMNEFKTRYCAFCRREHKIKEFEIPCDDDVLLDRPDPADQPDDLVATRMANEALVEQARKEMTPRTRQIADMIAASEQKLERGEIAKMLGVSSKTITRDLQQLSETLRTKHGWTTEDGAR